MPQSCGERVASRRIPASERDFDAMNKAELRKAATELGVPQCGVSVAELKAACKRAVQEQEQQKTLTARMAGNARVAESAAAPPDSNPDTIGKFATWYVRIINPKIICYEFKSKGETESGSASD